MKQKEENRARRMIVRLNTEEHVRLDKRFKKTTCRCLSEYVRKVLFDKPVTVYYRNQSMDEVLEELILLRKELNSIGINFNQAVRKLNSVSGMPESHKWQTMLTVLRDELEPSIRNIKDRMSIYSDVWLEGVAKQVKSTTTD